MSKLVFQDRFAFTPSARTFTDEGYLIVPAKIARPGIQKYAGRELMAAPTFPKDKFNETSVISVYRPPEEVFNKDSMNSFKNVAVTDNHPPALLNARTHKQYAVGIVLSDVDKDPEGECIQATIKITDADAINNVMKGKTEMSAGYNSYVIFESGVTPEGEPYDAIQRGIEGNHVAIVEKGKAGGKVKIADGREPKMPVFKVVVDGCSYDVMHESTSYFRLGQMMKDSAAEFIREAKIEKEELRGEVEDEDYAEVNAGHPTKSEPVAQTDIAYDVTVTLPSDKLAENKTGVKSALNDNEQKESYMDLEKELAEVKLQLADTMITLEKVTAAKDVAENALKDAQSKIPTVDAIDALVAEREAVIAKCKTISPDLEVAGKSNTELKKEVVLSKMAHLDGKTVTEAYIEAAFDLLEATIQPVERKVETKDTLTTAFETAVVSEGKQKELSAREKFLETSRTMWKK